MIAGVAHIIFRTMALDTVKRKGLKVELLDLDTRENPGYFAALKVQEYAYFGCRRHVLTHMCALQEGSRSPFAARRHDDGLFQ